MKLDVHIHSTFSRDGTASPQDIAKRCQQLRLDGFAITDHNAIKGSLDSLALGREYGLIVVRGIEVSTERGHVLAYGVSELVPKGLSVEETIDKIHGLGGLAVAPHPVRFPSGVGLASAEANNFDAIEVLNGGNSRRSNRMAQKLVDRLSRPVTGGSDAHRIDEVGKCYVEIESVSSEADVIDAISKARTRVGGRSRTFREGIIYSAETFLESAKGGFKRI